MRRGHCADVSIGIVSRLGHHSNGHEGSATLLILLSVDLGGEAQPLVARQSLCSGQLELSSIKCGLRSSLHGGLRRGLRCLRQR